MRILIAIISFIVVAILMSIFGGLYNRTGEEIFRHLLLLPILFWIVVINWLVFSPGRPRNWPKQVEQEEESENVGESRFPVKLGMFFTSTFFIFTAFIWLEIYIYSCVPMFDILCGDYSGAIQLSLLFSFLVTVVLILIRLLLKK